jgi:dihydroorotate dehydrogenase (NAD+) catalytic subunit
MIEDRLRINNKLPRSDARIVTASGCRATTLETILLYSGKFTEIAIFTTKSIGPKPNPGNHPPIYCADTSSSRARRNAVGLANPGADDFAKELAWLRNTSPNLDGAILLGSAYGGSIDEIAGVCARIAPHVDAIELNFSCPHAKGYGLDTGRDVDAVAKIVKVVAESTKRDVFAKLSPNLEDKELAEMARSCVDAGARGITVINTVGPGESYLPGTRIPVLFNRKGGFSGIDVKRRGLECTKIVRAAIGPSPLVIGMGGVFDGKDASDYLAAGADFIGIGTVMEGMDEETLRAYLGCLDSDIRDRKNSSGWVLSPRVNLKYSPAVIRSVQELSDTLRIYNFDIAVAAGPCQYLFLAVPGDDKHPTMEAPFSIPLSVPLGLAVRRYPSEGREHHFTSRLWEKKAGDELFIRGPYGMSFMRPYEGMMFLVGGGTGVAALASIAYHYDDYLAFVGAKTRSELLLLDRFRVSSTATEDGSAGYHGLVTDLFASRIDSQAAADDIVVTCGPQKMMESVVDVARKAGFPYERIFVVMEPHMKCGVGICGSCSLGDGTISCTDGHVVTADRFKAFVDAHKVKRNACGGWD